MFFVLSSLLSGCAPMTETISTAENSTNVHYLINTFDYRVFRVVDREANVVCYLNGDSGIDCMPLSDTNLY